MTATASNLAVTEFKPTSNPQEQRIREEISKQVPSASAFRFEKIGTEYIDGNTYMVEFSFIDKKGNEDESWRYAYVDSSDCRLFDSGDEAVIFMQGLLEKRRGFLQRIKDFDLIDVVGALIALPIVFTFVFIVITSKDTQNAISKEFLAIVSIILGYYFGRNKH
jgi:hypothetical protein